MGFRSTFTTFDYAIEWPPWFMDKYAASIRFPPGGKGPLHSISEHKTYMAWLDLDADIQRAIDWDTFPLNFVIVYLHECGGVTRSQIERDSIKRSEPSGWSKTGTDHVGHWYCYGCSDAD